MSENNKSSMPMIIAGFILLALAAFFGINMSQTSTQETASTETSPMDSATQAAGEAMDKAQEAATDATQAASDAAQQAGEDMKQATDDAAKKLEEMAPAAGTPAEAPKQEEPKKQ